jgi:excisionase family DNA binding protein
MRQQSTHSIADTHGLPTTRTASVFTCLDSDGVCNCAQPQRQKKPRCENPMIFEPLLTAEEAAEHLRIHVKTIQKLAREGSIPCVRMGKYWRFRLSALDQWVTAQQNRISQPFRVSDGGSQLAIHA